MERNVGVDGGREGRGVPPPTYAQAHGFLLRAALHLARHQMTAPPTPDGRLAVAFLREAFVLITAVPPAQ